MFGKKNKSHLDSSNKCLESRKNINAKVIHVGSNVELVNIGLRTINEDLKCSNRFFDVSSQ